MEPLHLVTVLMSMKGLGSSMFCCRQKHISLSDDPVEDCWFHMQELQEAWAATGVD